MDAFVPEEDEVEGCYSSLPPALQNRSLYIDRINAFQNNKKMDLNIEHI